MEAGIHASARRGGEESRKDVSFLDLHPSKSLRALFFARDWWLSGPCHALNGRQITFLLCVCSIALRDLVLFPWPQKRNDLASKNHEKDLVFSLFLRCFAVPCWFLTKRLICFVDIWWDPFGSRVH